MAPTRYLAPSIFYAPLTQRPFPEAGVSEVGPSGFVGSCQVLIIIVVSITSIIVNNYVMNIIVRSVLLSVF